MLKLRTFFQRFQQTTKEDLTSDTITISFDELRAAFKPFADTHNYEKNLHVSSSLDKDVANIRRALKNKTSNKAIALRKILVSIDSQSLAAVQAPYPQVTEFHFSKSDLSSLYDASDFLMELDNDYKDCRVIDIFNRAAYTISADKSVYAALHDNLLSMLQRHGIQPQWLEFPTESRTTLSEDTPMVDVEISSLTDLVHPNHKDKKLSDIDELKQFLQTLYFDLKPESYPDRFIVIRQTLASAIADLHHALPEQFPISPISKQSVVRPIRHDIIIDGFPEACIKIPQQILQALTNPKTTYLIERNDNNPLQHFNNHVHMLVNKHQVRTLAPSLKHETRVLGA